MRTLNHSFAESQKEVLMGEALHAVSPFLPSTHLSKARPVSEGLRALLYRCL